MISFQIIINGVNHSFIDTYKPPADNKLEFFLFLEDFIQFKVNAADPYFIIGDLNMDLLSSDGIQLQEFMDNNKLSNHISKPTRIATKFYSKMQIYKTSSTLIDVIIHNSNHRSNMIQNTDVICCPFSDHNFICADLYNETDKSLKFDTCGRNLKKSNFEKII